MPEFSVIVPVYNRPNEVEELLKSLEMQSYNDFEVIIIEDGSNLTCQSICENFKDKLNIRYLYKENTGQGFSRNVGASMVNSPWLIFFDSDVIVPTDYFLNVYNKLKDQTLDAFGGPDKAHSDFTDIQIALNYAMTSFLSTGGIRSQKKNVGGSYQLRSFNMGIKKVIFDQIGGFKKRDMGEDMEINNRLDLLSIHKDIIQEAYVYHKRRGNFFDFFKQIRSFGQTRIQLKRNYNISVKIVHLFPVIFMLGLFSGICLIFVSFKYSMIFLSFYLMYFLLLALDSTIRERNIKIGVLSAIAVFVQHVAYGYGFWEELFYGMKTKRQ